MQTPWYIYIISIVVGAPIFFLWGLAAYRLVRGLLTWVTADSSTAKK
jgi:hypothetical protein